MARAAIRMEELHSHGKYAQPGKLVLDVRSRAEYRQGHVPGSLNIPVSEIERAPERFRERLRSCDVIYVHCSSGQRAQRARDALESAGLANLVHVRDSGMADWVRQRYPVEREISVVRDLATGLVAGVVASLAAALADRALSPVVSQEQKRCERAVRAGSSHAPAAMRIGERITGRWLAAPEQHEARIAFRLGYGLVAGVIYALVRRRAPLATSLYGLPSGAAFFLVCDGVLAPLFRMSPGLQKIPWQFDGRELMNHIAWTGSAEAVHRGAERLV